ncbi:oxygen-independent coproporphyrinogen III oxidase [Silanimonas lenta]|uniref:oxygen-independent coproporphyrinogen III oxidase n=1 Tax=Silanimonas lenta TaxID=265429 RepID=UPI0004232F89|nr:oxygen-independent coproporphyrinogen III oxidase [Silanimonas lenta]
MPPTPLPFDAELIARHDRPGPRYTSYPPAPRFHEGFGRREFEAAIARSNEEPLPRRLSLYVHVPFCHSPCFYCGCNRVITRDAARGPAYRQRLQHEIDRIAPLFAPDREVVQLHFGGGTPNFLPVPELAAIVGHLRRHFVFADERQADLSLEVDPRTLGPDAMPGLRAIGFNRISLGIQDFDPAVQAAVNRRQGFEATHALVEAARAVGMRSVNVDLIYGLPRQSAAGFARTLEQVLALRPDRIAVYSYAHLPQMFRAQRRIDAAELPDPAQKIALLGQAIAALTAAGYVYIGMDHFALPFDELAVAQRRGGLHRNFMGYTTHADTDLVGFGASAISRIADAYAQNQRELAAWEAAIDAGGLAIWRGLVLETEDLIRADLIQSLMCHGEVDFLELGRRWDVEAIRLLDEARPRLAALLADGLVALEGDRLRVLPRGRLLLRVVAACFDPAAPPAVAA